MECHSIPLFISWKTGHDSTYDFLAFLYGSVHSMHLVPFDDSF